ncbi:MAG: sulfate ABC transporter ATP-binding protein, partial [Mariprofundaceae bacterium]|nr:sulfate ABC transporter ATP-binding protein [Mariprofundaceae bacterium]
INKSFGETKVLNNINLDVPSGGLIALLGPSGCGKTTLLRIIAGLEQADSGSVSFHGEDATRQHVRERGVGFVFQHYALFRHMSVFENVAFGLRVKPRGERPSDEEISRRVHELLQLVQLDWLADRYPSQLSGGQRQRIALARALAVEPKVLLLDEPFGALDAQVRKELRSWLRRLHDELHITSVFVTHDQEEALEVADQVVVLNAGKIEQVGTPDDIYEHPATPFVYRFLGNVNLFHGRVHDGHVHLDDLNIRRPNDGDIEEASKAIAFIRPHDLVLSRTPHDVAAIEATIESISGIGSTVRIALMAANSSARFEAELTRDEARAHTFKVGEKVFVETRNVRVFAEDYQI